MRSWQRYAALLLFLGSVAFGGGGLFLLLAAVPLEAGLKAAGWGQGAVDLALKATALLWLLLCAAAAGAYDRYLLRARPRLALVGAGAAALGAMWVCGLFLNTSGGFIASMRGGQVDQGGRYTFGPYPSPERLQELRREGYTDVITLLSPVIPFEKLLLDQEIAGGKQAGIAIHTVPMLPWLTSNRDALERIRQLTSQPGRRFYIHCYLGRHRAELVRQMLDGSGASAAVEPLPASLERGALTPLQAGRILLGPYPTDEEWFSVVLLQQVKEIVLTLSPDQPDTQPWVAKARKVAGDYGLKLTIMPLDAAAPAPAAVQQVAAYADSLPHKVYVMAFKPGHWSDLVAQRITNPEQAAAVPPLTAAFERGEVLRLGERLYFGPFPTDDEVTMLKRSGIATVVSLLNPANPDDKPWLAKEETWGLGFRNFPLPAVPPAPAQIAEVVRFLGDAPGGVYVHAYGTDARVRDVHRGAADAGLR